jgi:response regulator RpfG family c-di-GMP phosphodiesterase
MTRRARPPTSLRVVSTSGKQSAIENTLLLVENDRSLESSLKEFLASECYSLLYAENGREALETQPEPNPAMGNVQSRKFPYCFRIFQATFSFHPFD